MIFYFRFFYSTIAETFLFSFKNKYLNLIMQVCLLAFLQLQFGSNLGKYSIMWAGVGWFWGLNFETDWKRKHLNQVHQEKAPRPSFPDTPPKTFWDFKTFKMSANQQLSHYGDDENGKCFVVVLYLLMMKNMTFNRIYLFCLRTLFEK